MGLLDQVLGGLQGGQNTPSSPMQGVLAQMLGGGQQSGPSGGGMLASVGGIAGLLSMFQQAGLGHIVQSWIGSGQNLPVSPDQLQSALGQDRVQAMSGQAGMQPQDFLSELAQHLPKAVDGMTPNGQIPNNQTVEV